MHFAAIKERVLLTHPSSSKQTYHVVLDSPMVYEVGDCIGVHPQNAPHVVERILSLLGAKGHELVCDRKGLSFPLHRYLLEKANLARVTKELYTLVTGFEPPPDLADLEVQDLLSDYPGRISPEALAAHLAPLLPRLYSIASSQSVVGSEIHLTVSLSSYTKRGEARVGVASSFLCKNAPLFEPTLPIYLQKAKDFILPQGSDHRPIIMIGPGTGIAPFRGFLQERLHRKATGSNWLFFGERNRATDFYYEPFWIELHKSGKLDLDLAFSRDQAEKYYVQHRMLEKASQLWQQLQEDALFYVCGDASRMAKDVDATLHLIAEREGGLTPDSAKSFVKQLRKDKKYLRDVY